MLEATESLEEVVIGIETDAMVVGCDRCSVRIAPARPLQSGWGPAGIPGDDEDRRLPAACTPGVFEREVTGRIRAVSSLQWPNTEVNPPSVNRVLLVAL